MIWRFTFNRQLALKALNERLHQVQTPAEWPLLDQEEDSENTATVHEDVTKSASDSQQDTSLQEATVNERSDDTPPQNLPSTAQDQKAANWKL